MATTTTSRFLHELSQEGRVLLLTSWRRGSRHAHHALQRPIRACPMTRQARTLSAALLQGFASAISRFWPLASSGERASLVREPHLWSIRVVLPFLPYLPAPCFWGRLRSTALSGVTMHFISSNYAPYTSRKRSFLTVDRIRSLMSSPIRKFRNSASKTRCSIMSGVSASSAVHSTPLPDLGGQTVVLGGQTRGCGMEIVKQ